MAVAPTLTTTGLVLHNLGLASAFGGSLFGKVALNSSVKAISNKAERGKVTNLAWNGWNIVNAVGVGSAALTWLIGRTKLSGREISPTARTLTLVKDGLLGATVALGAANMATGLFLAKQAPEGAVPVEMGNTPTAETPAKAASAMRAINVMGIANIALMAGVIAITEVLNNHAATSPKWNLLARLLP